MKLSLLIASVFSFSFRMRLYEHSDFQGRIANYYATEPGCYNTLDFNDGASSASWTTDYANAQFCFFEHAACQGNQKCWKNGDSFPSNFAIDGINDSISSFKIYM